jgi:hypothetical protein
MVLKETVLWLHVQMTDSLVSWSYRLKDCCRSASNHLLQNTPCLFFFIYIKEPAELFHQLMMHPFFSKKLKRQEI